MNSLKGIFEDTKPKYKRNFIRENVKQLREMQGYWQNKEKLISNLSVVKPKNKYQNVPSRVVSQTSGSQTRNSEHPPKDKKTEIPNSASKTLSSDSTKQVSHVTQVGITRKSRSLSQRSGTKSRGTSEKEEIDLFLDENISSIDSSPVSSGRTRSLGCQTVDPKNTNDFNEGVIRYPSSRKIPSPKRKPPAKTPPTREMGLQTERLPSPVAAAGGDTPTSNDINKLDLEKLSFSQNSSDVEEPSEVPAVKHIRNLRGALSRNRTSARTNSPLKPPPTYKKGVIPKYLQERKEEWQKEAEQQILDAPDPDCPPGHVSLPDDKRIETLKMLKKRYASLVQELNMMPVRTDTLRMRSRKMELEKELDKMEHAIKVFSRSKVFVKIGDQ